MSVHASPLPRTRNKIHKNTLRLPSYNYGTQQSHHKIKNRLARTPKHGKLGNKCYIINIEQADEAAKEGGYGGENMKTEHSLTQPGKS